MFTFYKAWVGTRYTFILMLTSLLFIGNLGSIGAAISLHKASRKFSSDNVSLDIIGEVNDIMSVSSVCAAVRDACFSISIWCFAFRYWNISFVMLVRLRGQAVSTCFKASSISVFFIVLIINVILPVLRTVYAFKMNNADSKLREQEAWDEYGELYETFTYSIAVS